MTNIKEAIEQFKQDNGNQNFTLKEMIMYNVTKIDEMKNDLNTHLTTAAAEDGKLRGKVSILTKNVIGLWSMMGVLIVAWISKLK